MPVQQERVQAWEDAPEAQRCEERCAEGAEAVRLEELQQRHAQRHEACRASSKLSTQCMVTAPSPGPSDQQERMHDAQV